MHRLLTRAISDSLPPLHTVSENLAKDLPRALLDMLMAKNIERALHSQGFTAPSIFLASALAGPQTLNPKF